MACSEFDIDCLHSSKIMRPLRKPLTLGPMKMRSTEENLLGLDSYEKSGRLKAS